MNGLDLFSGIGGLGLALAPWVRPIAYCEIDPYARAVLLSRMADGSIANAPIWDDVCTLRGSDLPSVDIIFGGFPCQDLSLAGARAGLDGKRSGLFFQIMRLVDEVQPSFIFLENVPGVRQHANRVFAELAARGFDARWLHLAASDVGAPHKRERWWCLAANTNSFDVRNKQGRIESRPGLAGPGFDGSPQPVADATGERCRQGRAEQPRRERFPSPVLGGDLGNADREGEPQPQGVESEQRRWPFDASWWASEPDVGGTFDGLHAWLDARPAELGAIMRRVAVYVEATESRAVEVLRALRQGNESEALRGPTGGHGCVSAAQVLLAVLLGIKEERIDEARVQLASEEVSPEELRGMWSDYGLARPPRGSRPKQQRADEHSDALQDLSRLLALDAEAVWSRYRRENAPAVLSSWSEGWEDGFSRVAHGVPKRMDRLRGLGNAVVPAQAREAFRILSGIGGAR